MNKKMWEEVASIAYVLLFSYAATSKLFNLRLSYDQMRLQPFSDALRPYVVWGVPIVELAIVLVLLLPGYRLFGLRLATGLMLVFTGYILIAKMGFFTYTPCSCGGVISSFTWTEHLWFNLFFLLLSGLALVPRHLKSNLKLN